MNKNIITIAGAPSVGKSTIGKILSVALNTNFIDLDKEIEEVAGSSINKIFFSLGEKKFRIIENRVLFQIIKNTKEKTVLALGGGTLLNTKNKKLVNSHTILFTLTASVTTIINRNSHERPLAPNNAFLEKLLNKRKEHYTSLPNQINTENKTATEIANIIKKKVRSRWFPEDQPS